MFRKRLKKSRDKRIFRNTAMATRKINIDPRGMRGGIKL